MVGSMVIRRLWQNAKLEKAAYSIFVASSMLAPAAVDHNVVRVSAVSVLFRGEGGLWRGCFPARSGQPCGAAARRVSRCPPPPHPSAWQRRGLVLETKQVGSPVRRSGSAEFRPCSWWVLWPRIWVPCDSAQFGRANCIGHLACACGTGGMVLAAWSVPAGLAEEAPLCRASSLGVDVGGPIVAFADRRDCRVLPGCVQPLSCAAQCALIVVGRVPMHACCCEGRLHSRHTFAPLKTCMYQNRQHACNIYHTALCRSSCEA